jgi:hypothetical protein
MPYGEQIVSMGIDLHEGMMWINVSDGRQAKIPLGPNRCVADIWVDFAYQLKSLGLKIPINEKPQETADTTPFSKNRRDCTFVAEHAQRFYQILASLDGIFEEFRSDFFGRSGIQFWWGAFDFAVLLFNGKHEVAPGDRGYIMQYDLDAQQMNAGFWPGDDSTPNAAFYGYLYPRPDGCESAPMEPKHAGWVEAMQEWMMPYDAVRNSDNPRQAILDFLKSVYTVAVMQGGWDRKALEYIKPPK